MSFDLFLAFLDMRNLSWHALFWCGLSSLSVPFPPTFLTFFFPPLFTLFFPLKEIVVFPTCQRLSSPPETFLLSQQRSSQPQSFLDSLDLFFRTFINRFSVWQLTRLIGYRSRQTSSADIDGRDLRTAPPLPVRMVVHLRLLRSPTVLLKYRGATKTSLLFSIPAFSLFLYLSDNIVFAPLDLFFDLSPLAFMLFSVRRVQVPRKELFCSLNLEQSFLSLVVLSDFRDEFFRFFPPVVFPPRLPLERPLFSKRRTVPFPSLTDLLCQPGYFPCPGRPRV